MWTLKSEFLFYKKKRNVTDYPMRCLENDRKSGRGGAMKKNGVMQLREKDNTRVFYLFLSKKCKYPCVICSN